MNALFDALEAKFLNSALYNDAGGRVYLDQADTPDYPRVVYSVITAPKEKTFTEQYTNVLLQVDLFSARSAGKAVMTTMYNDLVALLDDKLMDITGYTLVWMREENLVPLTEEVDALPDGTTSILHWAVDWEIRISKN
jgi:hypothetical protein